MDQFGSFFLFGFSVAFSIAPAFLSTRDFGGEADLSHANVVQSWGSNHDGQPQAT